MAITCNNVFCMEKLQGSVHINGHGHPLFEQQTSPHEL